MILLTAAKVARDAVDDAEANVDYPFKRKSMFYYFVATNSGLDASRHHN